VFVVVECLFDGVEDAALPWVVADTGDVLPIAPVTSGVVVHEEAFIPLGSDSPIYVQV